MANLNPTPNNIFINYSKRALEITKKFRDEASIYGSHAYNELKEAKADFPTFRVCVRTTPKRKFEDKVDTKDMMLYIENHSGKDSAQMKEFLELRGKTVKEAGNRCDAVDAATLSEMREWFFLTYPELSKKTETRKNRINKILEDAAKNAGAEQNAASA